MPREGWSFLDPIRYGRDGTQRTRYRRGTRAGRTDRPGGWTERRSVEMTEMEMARTRRRQGTLEKTAAAVTVGRTHRARATREEEAAGERETEKET